MSGIITLTTDFGLKDYYLGAVKGRLHQLLPQKVQVIDITHQISPFNTREGAYVLRYAYSHFPKETVHIVGIDAEETEENHYMALSYDGHYFVGTDNGLFSMLFREGTPDVIVRISGQDKTSFPTLDIFCPVAVHLVQGHPIQELGDPVVGIKIKKEPSPMINQDPPVIKGHIAHINRYGNIVTNINRQMIQDIFKDRPYEINVRGYTFDQIYTNFVEVMKTHKDCVGIKLAVYDYNNNLNIAMYRGNPDTVGTAYSLMGLGLDMPVMITLR